MPQTRGYSIVSAEECEYMRHLERHGYNFVQIADRLDRTPPTIANHVRGECRHD